MTDRPTDGAEREAAAAEQRRVFAIYERQMIGDRVRTKYDGRAR